ncbi:DHHA1 domain-containing protein [Streptomyces sp. NPDC001407]|uniref:DHHA1 domain-containing protein n=1 Tax=Streptomyces sp. NPDC001407 TaxID=3364573 RepID=UPI0036A3BB13
MPATPQVTGLTQDELRQLASETLAQLPAAPSIVVLALEHSGKALLVASVSPHLLSRGVQAAQVITRAARTVDGGGGGTEPSQAQADAAPNTSTRPSLPCRGRQRPARWPITSGDADPLSPYWQAGDPR